MWKTWGKGVNQFKGMIFVHSSIHPSSHPFILLLVYLRIPLARKGMKTQIRCGVQPKGEPAVYPTFPSPSPMGCSCSFFIDNLEFSRSPFQYLVYNFISECKHFFIYSSLKESVWFLFPNWILTYK